MTIIQLLKRAGAVIEARCPDPAMDGYCIAILDLDTPDEGDHENIEIVEIIRGPIWDAVQTAVNDEELAF